MKKKECLEKLIEIMECKFQIPSRFFSDENLNLPLLDERWKMNSIILVYLILEIEKNFEIDIPPDYLKSNYTISVNNLAEEIAFLIESKLAYS